MMDVDMDLAAGPYEHYSQLPLQDLVLCHLNMAYRHERAPEQPLFLAMIVHPIDDAADHTHLSQFVHVSFYNDDFETKFSLVSVLTIFGLPSALAPVPISIAADENVSPVHMFDVLKIERDVYVFSAFQCHFRFHFVAVVRTYHRQDHRLHQYHPFHPYFHFHYDHDHFVIVDRTMQAVKQFVKLAAAYSMNRPNAMMLCSFQLLYKKLQMLQAMCYLGWLAVGSLNNKLNDFIKLMCIWHS